MQIFYWLKLIHFVVCFTVSYLLISACCIIVSASMSPFMKYNLADFSSLTH